MPVFFPLPGWLLLITMLFLGHPVTSLKNNVQVPFFSPDNNDTFLQDWIGHLLPVLGDQTLLDLSLPGCHDCMTWDDSNTVADNANDIEPSLAYILHNFGDFSGAGDLIRSLSRTQGLDMTQQLNNGLRFIDFRLIYTAPPKGWSSSTHDWFSLHLVESNQPAMKYLIELRQFMDAHPSEIVVIFFSQHGGIDKTGNDQYPDCTPAEKQAFYKQVMALFDGLVFDATVSSVNKTTVTEMIERGHRLVIYASDWAEFTNSDPTVIDTHVNLVSNGVASIMHGKSINSTIDYFVKAKNLRAEMKEAGQFFLLAMPGKPPSEQMEAVAELKYIPLDHSSIRKGCAKSHGVPGMDKWCPPTLVAEGQLANYYYQIVLDALVTDSVGKMGLPNALYMDAIDVGGLLRTGTADLPVMSPQWKGGFDKEEGESEGGRAAQKERDTTAMGSMNDGGRTDSDDGDDFAYLDVHDDDPFATTGFAYVDTVLLYNVQRICNDASAGVGAGICSSLMSQLDERRARAPLNLWHDSVHGRLLGWPDYSLP